MPNLNSGKKKRRHYLITWLLMFQIYSLSDIIKRISAILRLSGILFVHEFKWYRSFALSIHYFSISDVEELPGSFGDRKSIQTVSKIRGGGVQN